MLIVVGGAGDVLATEQELAVLRSQAEDFEGALADIRQRIEQLEVEAQE